MADVADAVCDAAGIGNARDGDPLAGDDRIVPRAVEPLDRYADFGARVALERGRGLFVGVSCGILAVDGDDLVADADARPVGRRAFVGLREDDAVAFLADERAHAAVFAGGHDLEVRHLLRRDEFGVGVQIADHAPGGAEHEFIGVDRIDVAYRELAHHVDGDLHVAAQAEIVAAAEETQGGHAQEAEC